MSGLIDALSEQIRGATLFDVLGALGVALTLLGLWFTYRQARTARKSADGAKSAAEASSEAVARTQQVLRQNQSLRLVPSLWSTHGDLEIAVSRGDADAVLLVLRQWCQRASEMTGLIEDEWPDSSEIVVLLRRSVGHAATAGRVLVEDRERPVPDSSSRARAAILKACNALGEFEGKNTLKASDKEAEIA